MLEKEKIIYVYDDFTEDEPILLGRLYVGIIKGGETYSFEYDNDWLKKSEACKPAFVYKKHSPLRIVKSVLVTMF